MAIIKSLIDTDFYTFTQQMVVLHQCSGVQVRYAFKWRNWDKMNLRISIEDFAGRLKKELDAFCELRFTEEELNYLSSIPFLKPDLIEFLRLYKCNRRFVRVYVENGELKIAIEGPWLHTILFEVPVLAIVSELYTQNCADKPSDWVHIGQERTLNKCDRLEAYTDTLSLIDFSTRRRASFEHQAWVVNKLASRNLIIGTSNVYLAMRQGIKPIGTMAHQFLMAYQQLGPRLIDSQQAALQAWANEYRGELGIALSDTLGFKAFLKDFDRYFALLFDGCRHDSGDPIRWGWDLIDHYKSLRIGPMTKTAVFSDGLDINRAIQLDQIFKDWINTSFGIGTSLGNDCGFTAPGIVLKMVECNGMPVAKISDSKGKGMCEDDDFLKYLNQIVKNKISR